MSKVILLGDTHLGVRNGADVFSDYFNKFFDDVLFPYMRRHSITQIYQLGDLFDNRTNISLKAFHKCKKVWFGNLRENGYTMHVLLGNHDIHFRNTLEINSPNLLLEKEYSDVIRIYDRPTTIDEDGLNIDIIPWICDENFDEVNAFISRDGVSRVLLGHLELAGFPMYKGSDAKEGMSPTLLKAYEQVYTGHYHTQSSKGNVTYLGTPYELTWADYNDPKGFFVFDIETLKTEFIQNEDFMFHKLIYNNGCDYEIDYVKQRYVKLIVQAKADVVAFDKFVTKLKAQDPVDLAIVDNDVFVEELTEEQLSEKDTKTFIESVINEMETTVDKTELKSFINSLYQEAMTLE